MVVLLGITTQAKGFISMPDYHLLGLGNFTSLIKRIDVKLWGKEVMIHCLYDPVARQPYVLIFKNCREIHWNIYGEDADLQASETDLIGFLLGRDNYRKPATINTNLFELSVLYGDFEIQKSQSF